MLIYIIFSFDLLVALGRLCKTFFSVGSLLGCAAFVEVIFFP